MDRYDAPPFTLRQLSYLVTAAETGTVAAAANRLRVSASAISDGLTELERAMDARLTVRRRAHGLSLTPAGARVAERAAQLLTAAHELAASLQGPDGELAGPIAIGCYPTLAPLLLPTLLQEFGDAHPGVELEILEATQDRLEGRIESGEIDVAFVYDTMIPGHPRRAMLFEMAAHILVAGTDALANADVIRLEDVADRELILLDAPPSREHTLSLFAARGLTPRVRHRTTSFEAVRTLVGRGLGYGILVQRPANQESYEGYPLVMKEIEPTVPPVGVDVIWSAATEPSARVTALLRFARSARWPQSPVSA